MKKLLLLGFSLLLVSALSAHLPALQFRAASSLKLATDTLELLDVDGNKINNGTITVKGSDPNVDALVGYIWVKNTTNTEMPNMFVRRVINYEVPNSSNSFCFGINCYGPLTNESVIADTAKVGILDKSFSADYYPAGNGGLSSITYEFFDNITFGVPVIARATIEFHISAAGIDENKQVFKGPYPNPASQYTNFEYNLPASYTNAQLIIRNMLGVEIESLNIENRSGKKSIDVSSYASGIYFYSFIVDGKVVQSRKLIVKH
ncbi:MAG: T9SS type A sorting domain-containing protein [Bacteroidota bacterium]